MVVMGKDNLDSGIWIIHVCFRARTGLPANKKIRKDAYLTSRNSCSVVPDISESTDRDRQKCLHRVTWTQ